MTAQQRHTVSTLSVTGPFLYPEGIALHSPGSRSAPWESNASKRSTAKRLHNARRLALCNRFAVDAVPASLIPGCAARPWAMECNPFGIKSRCPFAPTARENRRAGRVFETRRCLHRLGGSRRLDPPYLQPRKPRTSQQTTSRRLLSLLLVTSSFLSVPRVSAATPKRRTPTQRPAEGVQQRCRLVPPGSVRGADQGRRRRADHTAGADYRQRAQGLRAAAGTVAAVPGGMGRGFLCRAGAGAGPRSG